MENRILLFQNSKKNYLGKEKSGAFIFLFFHGLLSTTMESVICNLSRCNFKLKTQSFFIKYVYSMCSHTYMCIHLLKCVKAYICMCICYTVCTAQHGQENVKMRSFWCRENKMCECLCGLASTPICGLSSTAKLWLLVRRRSGSLPGTNFRAPAIPRRESSSAKHCPAPRRSGCWAGEASKWAYTSSSDLQFTESWNNKHTRDKVNPKHAIKQRASSCLAYLADTWSTLWTLTRYVWWMSPPLLTS